MKEQNKHYRLTRSLGLAVAATSAVVVATVPGAASASPASSISVEDHTLTLRGTSGADTVVVDFEDPGTIAVDLGDGTGTRVFARGTFDRVSAALGAGDDVFRTLRGGTTTSDLPLTVDGDAGDDTIGGGNADDTLSGGAGDDVLTGGLGTDVLFGDAGADTVDGGVGTDTEVLGSGDDTALWNPGEGNDTVAGESGRDALVFNGSGADERMSLSANGESAVLLRSVGSIRMDLTGVEQVRVATLGGADSMIVGDLGGTDVTTALVDLGATGGGGDASADSVVVDGTERGDAVTASARGTDVDVTGLAAETVIRNGEPSDRLEIRTLGGADSVTVTEGVTALIDLAFDLGTDQP